MPLGKVDKQGPTVIKPLPRSQVPDWFGRPAQTSNLILQPVAILGRVYVHRRIAPAFAAVLKTIAERGDAALIDKGDYGGTYNNRTVRRSTARSPHAWAIAIDLNVHHFLGPDGDDEKKTRTNFHCSRSEIAPSLAELAPYFNAWGFSWGGHWNRAYIDPMHFEATELTVKLLESGLGAEEEDVINAARAKLDLFPVGDSGDPSLQFTLVLLPGYDNAFDCVARTPEALEALRGACGPIELINPPTQPRKFYIHRR